MSKRNGTTYLGTFQLGDWVAMEVRTENSSGVITAPTSTSDKAPIGSVHVGSTTKVETIKFNILDPVVSPAVFTKRLRLSSSYAAGNYTVHVRYTTDSGAFIGYETFAFRVVAGGSATGAVTSAFPLQRPEAMHYVHAVDSGAILEGRNPY